MYFTLALSTVQEEPFQDSHEIVSTCRGKQASEVHFTKCTENLKTLLKVEFSFFNSFITTLATLLPKSVLLKICILFRSLAVTAGILISATITAQLRSYKPFCQINQTQLQEDLKHAAKHVEYLKCSMIMKVRAVGRPLGIAESCSSFLQGEDAGCSRLTQKRHFSVILRGQPQLLLPMTQLQRLTDGT